MKRNIKLLVLIPLLLYAGNIFINLYLENKPALLHGTTPFQGNISNIAINNLENNTIFHKSANSFKWMQITTKSYDKSTKRNKSEEKLVIINVTDETIAKITNSRENVVTTNIKNLTNERIDYSSRTGIGINHTTDNTDIIKKLDKSNMVINQTGESIKRVSKPPERDIITNQSVKLINKRVSKPPERVVKIKQAANPIDALQVIEQTLDLNKILLSASNTAWPIVVMGNPGRTGNCFNSYAIALALRQEFGGNATIAVRRNVFDRVAKIIDIRGLTLPLVDGSFQNRVNKMKMNVNPGKNLLDTENLVAHLKPSIRREIDNFNSTLQKKVLILDGYPNRMYMIADYQDEIRRSFIIKSNLLNKAQAFLHKMSVGRGDNIVFVGFHIRRTDYVKHSEKYNGVSVPGPAYYLDALTHYRERFENVLFVVASDDLKHAHEVLHHHKDVVFTEMKKLEEDMALLASCNHSIMTVGSFGWWSSYLAGGDVVYALLSNFTIPPFAHPEMLGPHGFENFIGIPVK